MLSNFQVSFVKMRKWSSLNSVSNIQYSSARNSDCESHNSDEILKDKWSCQCSLKPNKTKVRRRESVASSVASQSSSTSLLSSANFHVKTGLSTSTQLSVRLLKTYKSCFKNLVDKDDIWSVKADITDYK